MRRAKQQGRLWRYRFDDGDEVSLPEDEALGKLALSTFAHAATVLDDEARRASLQNKAREYEAAWRAAIERRTLAEEAMRKRSKGGTKTAEQEKIDAQARDKKLKAVARSIRKDQPGIKTLALATILKERGLGGVESLRKRLPRLLRRSDKN